MNTTDVSTNSKAARPRTSQSLLRKVMRVLIFCAILYAALLVMLVFSENSMVYPGSDETRGNWKPTYLHEEIEFTSADGTKLVGWYLPQQGATETLLHCHGNAENVAQTCEYMGQQLRYMLNANVFVFDYRGYGKSEGTPNEAGVLADSEAALQWLAERTGKPTNEIIVSGHSLGGGPAVDLGSKQPLKLLILQRTFASTIETAQSRFWFVPCGLLMQNRFESAEKIKTCEAPIFQSHGELDQLISIESGKRLFDNAPTDFKEFYPIPEANHWSNLPDNYWLRLREFVYELNQRR